MVIAKEGRLQAERKPIPDRLVAGREKRAGAACDEIYVAVLSCPAGQDDPLGGRGILHR